MTMLTTTTQGFEDMEASEAYPRHMVPAPPLPSDITSLFGSVKHSGRFSVPPELHLKAAFAELKVDLREALFPEKNVLLVCESLCASVEIRLPEGVTVVDHSASIFASHKVGGAAEEHGPVIYLDGWNVCSDVKVTSD